MDKTDTTEKFGKEYWDKIKKQGKETKEQYQHRVYVQAHQAMNMLKSKGYTVESKNNGWQWRVNGKLDIYPRNQRWHDLRDNTRGGYTKYQKRLYEFVMMKLDGIKI